jgi:hypothetical protein
LAYLDQMFRPMHKALCVGFLISISFSYLVTTAFELAPSITEIV